MPVLSPIWTRIRKIWRFLTLQDHHDSVHGRVWTYDDCGEKFQGWPYEDMDISFEGPRQKLKSHKLTVS